MKLGSVYRVCIIDPLQFPSLPCFSGLGMTLEFESQTRAQRQG
jgi:hypothetical protein